MNSLRFKSKIILAKNEASYGVDPTLTGAANGMLMTGVTWSPMDGDDVSRDLELPYLAAQGKIPVGLRTRLQGKVELVGSGTAGVAPKWGPLLRACGVAETIEEDTSVTYNPITDDQESAAIAFWIGGTKQLMLGCRGTVTPHFTAQAIPYLEFDFTGLYADPAEVARVAPDLSGFIAPDVVTHVKTPTFTVNDVNLKLRELTLAMGNDVQPRLLAGAGADEIIIVDRADAITAHVEAVPVSTLNPFALAKAQTLVPVQLVHGTVAGRIVTLDVPSAQVGRLSGIENQQNIVEWPLDLVPLPTDGDDQWTLTLT